MTIENVLCGWLSPEGEYVNCGFMEHDIMAAKILNTDQLYFANEWLTSLGWLMITQDNIFTYYGLKPTESQMLFLKDKLTSSQQYCLDSIIEYSELKNFKPITKEHIAKINETHKGDFNYEKNY